MTDEGEPVPHELLLGRCKRARARPQSSPSGLCLPTEAEPTLNWCRGVGLHSDSDFLDIIAQPLTFTHAAFADRLYQGGCDACNIYILLSGHRNIALLAEVSADYFCSAQSQAMDPVAEAAICTSLLPQKAWA